MAHVEKFTRGSLPGLASHIERKTENHANKDIDISRSHLNYSLLDDGSNMLERVQRRLKVVHALKRKDVNLVSSWVVTLPKPLRNSRNEDVSSFFKETHQFLTERYGGIKNVMASEVHMDESMPHMHFTFMPVVYDPNKKEKVSAKEVLTRRELQNFHKDLDNYLKETIPNIYEKGIINGKTLGLDNVAQIKLHDDIIQKAKKDAKTSLKGVEIEYETKKEYLKSARESSELSMMYPSYIKHKKTWKGEHYILVPKEKWEEKHVSTNQVHNFEQAQKKMEKEIQEYKSLDGMSTA